MGSSQLASAMAVASGSKHLDVVLVEDCSDDEILAEDQLDFNFTDEECEDSPQAHVMLPAPLLSPPPPLLPAEQPPLLPKKVMSSAPISGSKELAPPPLQVSLYLLPATTNGETFSVQINPLAPAPNLNISHLTTFPKPVLYPQRTSNLDLTFGIFVLWVMFLGKILASKPFKELSPLIGSVRPRSLSMRLAG